MHIHVSNIYIYIYIHTYIHTYIQTSNNARQNLPLAPPLSFARLRLLAALPRAQRKIPWLRFNQQIDSLMRHEENVA